MEQIKEELARAGAPSLAKYIVDRTGQGPGNRGRQISDWILCNNFRGTFIIIDDDSDMLPSQKPLFIQTSFDDGFRAKHYTAAMWILDPKHADSQIVTPA